MALTVAQKIALFEILETSYAGYVDVPVDIYHLTATRYVPANTEQKVQQKILERLALLSSEEEAVLTTYIEQWQDIRTCTTSIQGDVGGTTGVAFDPFTQMKRIQSLVKILVPVAQYYSEFTVDGVRGGFSQVFGGR
jgi:hypothetical protein